MCVILMKVIIICFQLFMLGVTQEPEYYDRKYDYFDIQALLQNTRLLRKYLHCFLDRGPCPPVGRVFKSLLPEVVMTRCGKCSPRQKVFVWKVVDAFDKFLPVEHAELKQKLDPNNKYYDAFVASLRST